MFVVLLALMQRLIMRHSPHRQPKNDYEKSQAPFGCPKIVLMRHHSGPGPGALLLSQPARYQPTHIITYILIIEWTLCRSQHEPCDSSSILSPLFSENITD